MMESKMDKIQKSYMDNLSQDLCNTCEGAQFMAKYLTSKTTIFDLGKKILDVLKDSDLSAAEAIGFMDYMKHYITANSYIPSIKSSKEE